MPDDLVDLRQTIGQWVRRRNALAERLTSSSDPLVAGLIALSSNAPPDERYRAAERLCSSYFRHPASYQRFRALGLWFGEELRERALASRKDLRAVHNEAFVSSLILAAQAVQSIEPYGFYYDDFPVPEWGGEVRIAPLSLKARAELRDLLQTEGPFECKVLVRCLVNSSGSPIFAADDDKLLAQKSAVVLDKIFYRAAELTLASDENQQILSALSQSIKSRLEAEYTADLLHEPRKDFCRRTGRVDCGEIADGTNPLVQADNRLLVRALLRAGRLTEDETAILYLHYFEGRTFPEIADHLRITEAAAWKRHERALKKLKSLNI